MILDQNAKKPAHRSVKFGIIKGLRTLSVFTVNSGVIFEHRWPCTRVLCPLYLCSRPVITVRKHVKTRQTMKQVTICANISRSYQHHTPIRSTLSCRRVFLSHRCTGTRRVRREWPCWGRGAPVRGRRRQVGLGAAGSRMCTTRCAAARCSAVATRDQRPHDSSSTTTPSLCHLHWHTPSLAHELKWSSEHEYSNGSVQIKSSSL